MFFLIIHFIWVNSNYIKEQHHHMQVLMFLRTVLGKDHAWNCFNISCLIWDNTNNFNNFLFKSNLSPFAFVSYENKTTTPFFHVSSFIYNLMESLKNKQINAHLSNLFISIVLTAHVSILALGTIIFETRSGFCIIHVASCMHIK